MRTLPQEPATRPAGADEAVLAHLTGLRLDPRSANPVGWRVDWDDAPWPVTVRAGGARQALRTGSGDALMDAVQRLLRGTFSIGRVRVDPRGGLPATPQDPLPRHRGPRIATRRPIPSGGSMYPTEAYLLLTGPDRLCHHDPYRHELVDLGHPAPTEAVRHALGGPLPAPVLLVLTHRFWKNFYKYGDFAYRLGAVDVGVALGRALRLGAITFGRARTHLDFDDDALAGCLGADPELESPYAVVGLGTGAGPGWTVAVWGADSWPRGGPAPAVVERSRRLRRSARFDAAHAAARRPAPATSPPGRAGPADGPSPSPTRVVEVAEVALPSPLPVDLGDPAVLARRTSNGRLFRPRPADPAALATVLAGTASALTRLRHGSDGVLGGDVALYCAVQRVRDVAAGWYRYRPGGALRPVAAWGEVPDGRAVGPVLQRALFAGSVNVELAAFTVHVAAAGWPHGRGVRGYREQQLAIGAAIEAITLLAAAVGLGNHPVLGFDVAAVEAAYGLTGTAVGVHAQVSVGPVRPDPDWEITVMPT